MSSNSLGGWGYAVEVLWWGQSDKQQHQDIDEVLVAGRWNEVKALAPDESLQLHPQSTRGKLGEALDISVRSIVSTSPVSVSNLR